MYYARRNWFSDYWIPGVTLKTTINTEQLSAKPKNSGLSVNAALVKVLAQALSEFPKLNYYTFWGKLVWAGSCSDADGKDGALCNLSEAEFKQASPRA